MRPTAVTFFSGAGGACCGLEQAGFDVIWGNEYYEPIADIWQANHPTATLDRRSIHDIPYSDIPWADAYWFSPPCQLFSGANPNRTGGTEAEDISIALQMSVIIRLRRPRWVVIENVPEYGQSYSFRRVIVHLKAAGYSVDWKVVNSANYGVPQTRRRLILVARLDGVATLPLATHARHWSGQLSLFELAPLPWVGWLEAVSDLLPSLRDAKFSEPQLSQLRKKGLASCERPLLVQLTGHGKKSGPQIKTANQPFYTATVSIMHDNKPTKKTGFPCVVSPATISIGKRILKVDWRCVARWQGFPDDYQWADIAYLNCRGIGNAVPPPLAKAIGLTLK